MIHEYFNSSGNFTVAWTLNQSTSTLINSHTTHSKPHAEFTNGNANLSDWGPKRDPLYIVVPFTIIYSVIFLTGVIGNISTCIVIARNKSMHTATNYYLFSLAISDLLLLVSGLPTEIYSIWSKYPYVFGEIFCVLQGFAAETSANATVLTITAFTIERYVAICHPFLSHTMSKLSRAIKFIMVIWLVAMCLAVPQAMSLGIYFIDEEHQVCNVERIIIPHAFELSTLLFFVAPMSLITVLYILIGLQLHRSTVGPSRGNSVKMKHRVYKPVGVYTATTVDTQGVVHNGDMLNGDEKAVHVNKDEQEDGRKNYARNAQAAKHVVKMLVAVVVAFFICWAPFHAQRLLAIHGKPTTANMITAFRILTYISGVLYYLSTTVNPLLYHIMSHKFREAFKDTFKRFLCRSRRSTGRRYNTLSGRCSSQPNSHSRSHSNNTDTNSHSACSRQSSLRYLEVEIARLHDSKRPLVVSFKRKPPRSNNSNRRLSPKHVTILDAELQDALDRLQEESMKRRELIEEQYERHYKRHKDRLDIMEVEKSLQYPVPQHLCSKMAYYKQDSILNPNVLNGDVRRGRSKSHVSWDLDNNYRLQYCQIIPKSSTMPHIDGASYQPPLTLPSSNVSSEEELAQNLHVDKCRKGSQHSSCSRLETFSAHNRLCATTNDSSFINAT